MTIRGDRELDRLCLEESKNSLKVRVHSILTGAQVDRAHGQTLHDGAHLIKRQPIDTIRIAITERASQIALVRQRQAERELSRLFFCLFCWCSHPHRIVCMLQLRAASSGGTASRTANDRFLKHVNQSCERSFPIFIVRLSSFLIPSI